MAEENTEKANEEMKEEWGKKLGHPLTNEEFKLIQKERNESWKI
jgi:hypothetical protein